MMSTSSCIGICRSQVREYFYCYFQGNWHLGLACLLSHEVCKSLACAMLFTLLLQASVIPASSLAMRPLCTGPISGPIRFHLGLWCPSCREASSTWRCSQISTRSHSFMPSFAHVWYENLACILHWVLQGIVLAHSIPADACGTLTAALAN